MRPGGGQLPRGVPGGGVAKALRDERASTTASSSSLKGKGREVRDPPPHMAAIAGLQSNGEDILGDNIYGVSSFSHPAWHEVFPVTRSQVRDAKKGNTADKKVEADPKAPTASAPKTQIHPIPWRQPIPAHQPQVSTSKVPQPHPSNTEEAWRQRKNVTKTSTPQAPTDANAQDPNKTGNKPTSGYHFTSSIQEMIDGDVVQQKILNTLITLPLKEILGISPDMQKRFSGLTKTRREYTSKLVIATPHDETDGVIQEEYSPGVRTSSKAVADRFQHSELHVSFDEETEDVEEILIRYSSAVKIHTNSLFAMTTGHFEGILAGHHVSFMIDTGSELNLIADALFRQTNLALDHDGARWSLKGINGGAVPLVGCCRDVPVTCGGHRFDHHFFVSREGTGKQDVILGQPWLQWYSATLCYSRTGAIEMCLWSDGDRERGRPPTLSVQLVAPNAPRNTDKLTFQGKRTTIEEVSDSEN